MLTVSPRVSSPVGGGGGVLVPGGISSGGGLVPGGGVVMVVSQYALRQTPPPLWTKFLTHATENFTLPQTSFAGGNNFETTSITSNLRSQHLMKYICKHITGPWKQMYKTSINFDCDINSMKENILQHNFNYF